MKLRTECAVYRGLDGERISQVCWSGSNETGNIVNLGDLWLVGTRENSCVRLIEGFFSDKLTDLSCCALEWNREVRMENDRVYEYIQRSTGNLFP